LTTDEIRNSKAYKEYYACAIGEAAPKTKASAKKKKGESASSTTPPTPTPITTVESAPRLSATAKGKQPARAISPTEPTDVQRTEAEQLKIALKRSRQETYISQQRSFDTDEGTGSKPGVPDVPSDDLEEELSWNSSDDEDHGGFGTDEGTGSKTGVPDVPSDDSEEEISWNSLDDKETDTQEQDRHDDEGDEKDESDNDEEDDDDGKDGDKSDDDDDEEEIAKIDDQGLRISEEERIHEEEEADELYHDVNINQGRGLQVSQDIEDSHVTLTPVHPDVQEESSSVSSQFMTSMLNPTSVVGMESIFATASSSVAPLHTPTPTMTPSIITTITTASHPPIPLTPIPSKILQNLPTFDSVFRFDERLKSLEANFSEYRQTNPFAEAVSNILGIVHQYMNQQLNEAVRVAVQIQTDRLRDSYQRENDEFLRTIDDNMKRIIKEQIILDTYGEGVILNRRRDDDDDQARTPLEPATRSAGRSITGSKSRQASTSKSAFAEEPVQTTSQIEEPSHLLEVDTLTPELLAGPTYELMKETC
nr:hypothetical protein [Tanacetum cinerariifolium]